VLWASNFVLSGEDVNENTVTNLSVSDEPEGSMALTLDVYRIGEVAVVRCRVEHIDSNGLETTSGIVHLCAAPWCSNQIW